MLFNKRKKLNIFILLAAAALLSLPVAATATKLIPSDLSIGTWDSANRIYTLNTNVSETIQIDEDNLTLDGAGYTVTGAGSGDGVYLNGRTGVTITNLTVESFTYGINLSNYCSNNTLTGNTVSNNSSGIYLYNNSSNNTLTGNTASNNNNGIRLYDNCRYNTLTGNTTASNNGHGIFLSQSSNNTLTCNTTASNNGHGIYLDQSSSTNTLTGNTVSNNSSPGINLYNYSSTNTLTGNTVSNNNSDGILLFQSATNTLTGNTVASNTGYGIFLYDSSTNEIYNNNFIDNTTQAYVLLGGGNVFNQDPPTGGNYWSDHTSPAPYIFTGGQDTLPWTEMDGWQQTPSQMMVLLANDVIALNLQQGIENSLDAKLNAALGALDDINANNDVAAINTLQAFINAVEAQRYNKISDAEADDLIAATQEIIALLSGAETGC